MSERILVFGSHGYIGSAFLKYILEVGYSGSIITADFVSSELPFEHIKLDQSYSLETVLNDIQPNRIINLAGKTFGKSLEDFLNPNVVFPEKLMKYSSENGVILFLIGSAAEFADSNTLLSEDSVIAPNNYYGLSKSFQFQLAQYYWNMGSKVIYLRPFNLYDRTFSKGGLINEICRNALFENVSQINILSQDFIRDFISIDYLTYVLNSICFSELNKNDFDFNICSSTPISYFELAELLANLCNITVKQTKDEINKRGFNNYSVGDNSKVLKRFKLKKPNQLKMEIQEIFGTTKR